MAASFFSFLLLLLFFLSFLSFLSFFDLDLEDFLSFLLFSSSTASAPSFFLSFLLLLLLFFFSSTASSFTLLFDFDFFTSPFTLDLLLLFLSFFESSAGADASSEATSSMPRLPSSSESTFSEEGAATRRVLVTRLTRVRVAGFLTTTVFSTVRVTGTLRVTVSLRTLGILRTFVTVLTSGTDSVTVMVFFCGTILVRFTVFTVFTSFGATVPSRLAWVSRIHVPSAAVSLTYLFFRSSSVASLEVIFFTSWPSCSERARRAGMFSSVWRFSVMPMPAISASSAEISAKRSSSGWPPL